MQEIKICVLEGDGIGPEIVRQAVKVLKAACEASEIQLTLDYALLGGAAIDETGVPLPDETVAKCKAADAVLLGAVGGEKWDNLPSNLRPEKGLLGIRSALGLFANLRPASIYPALKAASPLKDEIVGAGVDILVVRELTGDVYFGEHNRKQENGFEVGYDIMQYATWRSNGSRGSRLSSRANAGAGSLRWTRRTCWKPPGSGARQSPAWQRNIRMYPFHICMSTTRPCSWCATRRSSMFLSPAISSAISFRMKLR